MGGIGSHQGAVPAPFGPGRPCGLFRVSIRFAGLDEHAAFSRPARVKAQGLAQLPDFEVVRATDLVTGLHAVDVERVVGGLCGLALRGCAVQLAADGLVGLPGDDLDGLCRLIILEMAAPV